jgi:hypothetical protein
MGKSTPTVDRAAAFAFGWAPKSDGGARPASSGMVQLDPVFGFG